MTLFRPWHILLQDHHRFLLQDHAFEWEKLVKCHLKRISCMEWAAGLNINDSDNFPPHRLICPSPRFVKK